MFRSLQEQLQARSRAPFSRPPAAERDRVMPHRTFDHGKALAAPMVWPSFSVTKGDDGETGPLPWNAPWFRLTWRRHGSSMTCGAADVGRAASNSQNPLGRSGGTL